MALPPNIVAEIGSSHGGDGIRGDELIAAAAESGADCAKFQIIFADEIVHPKTGAVLLAGAAVSLYDRFRALERPIDFYLRLREGCHRRGIGFLVSIFGLRSLRLVQLMQEERVKVASPELNHLPLLRAIADAGLKTMLSTGVSTLSEIESALDIVGRDRTTLLHCVTAYPAPAEEYNLRLLTTLRSLLCVPVGVSDHTTETTLIAEIATALGAAMIEKHLTLSANGDQLDDAIALTPERFAAMTQAVRAMQEASRGDVSDEQALLAAVGRRYGERRVAQVLGDGVKRLAPSERDSYGRTNRSIHALVEIDIGEPFTTENCAILRSERNLRPGLPPAYWDALQERRAGRVIPAGEGITHEDVADPGLIATTF